MTLSDPNPGFKVTGYLTVKYLADGARVFNCTKHSCRSLGALPKRANNWGSSLNFFFAKSVGRFFTSVMEIKRNSVSLRWNFYADMQLIRRRFGLQLWTLKNSASYASRENTLLRCGKIPKMYSPFAAISMGAAYWVRRTAPCWACLFIALFTTVVGGRVYMILNMLLYITV